MAKHEVKNEENKQEKDTNMETAKTTPEASEYRYKPEQID